jgi:hypothetical protein
LQPRPGLLRSKHLPTLGATADAEGIDASIGGIIKRVLLLLLALSGLGAALFYVGLKFAFPDDL